MALTGPEYSGLGRPLRQEAASGAVEAQEAGRRAWLQSRAASASVLQSGRLGLWNLGFAEEDTSSRVWATLQWSRTLTRPCGRWWPPAPDEAGSGASSATPLAAQPLSTLLPHDRYQQVLRWSTDCVPAPLCTCGFLQTSYVDLHTRSRLQVLFLHPFY